MVDSTVKASDWQVCGVVTVGGAVIGWSSAFIFSSFGAKLLIIVGVSFILAAASVVAATSTARQCRTLPTSYTIPIRTCGPREMRNSILRGRPERLLRGNRGRNGCIYRRLYGDGHHRRIDTQSI